MKYTKIFIGFLGIALLVVSFFYPLLGIYLAILFLIISLIIYRLVEIKIQEKSALLLVSTIVFLIDLVQLLLTEA